MMETIARLVDGGGLTLWLVLAASACPGLALVVLERLRGHEVELKGPLWAAVFSPLAIALAGSRWRAAFADASVESAEGAARVVWLGAGLTLSLALLAAPAVAAARRRRKPYVPAPLRAAP